jgi:predicted enzyme related to lactoylglutathione lyase
MKPNRQTEFNSEFNRDSHLFFKIKKVTIGLSRFRYVPASLYERNSIPSQPKKEITMKHLGISFGFVKIPVTNFAAACVFYRDVLGLEEEFAVEQYGWAQYSAGNASICLYVVGMSQWDGIERAAKEKAGIDTGIQLRITDAKSAYDAITHRGGKASKLNTGDDGTIAFSVVDPDGNVLGIAQVPTA